MLALTRQNFSGCNMEAEMYAIKPFILGSFITAYFMWKYRGYKTGRRFKELKWK